MPKWKEPTKIEAFYCECCGELAELSSADVCFRCKKNICEACISDKTEDGEALCIDCGE